MLVYDSIFVIREIQNHRFLNYLSGFLLLLGVLSQLTVNFDSSTYIHKPSAICTTLIQVQFEAKIACILLIFIFLNFFENAIKTTCLHGQIRNKCKYIFSVNIVLKPFFKTIYYIRKKGKCVSAVFHKHLSSLNIFFNIFKYQNI